MSKPRRLLFQKGYKKRPCAESVQFLTSLAENDGQIRVREKEYFGGSLDSVIEGAFNREFIVFEVDADYPGFICISITQKGLDTLESISAIGQR